MKIRKSTCGLCKPHKKYKLSSTKRKRFLEKALVEGYLTASLVRKTEKRIISKN